jgi:hypothetical protein
MFHSQMFNVVMYAVFAWLIITGSGWMIGFIGTYLQLQSNVTAHNQWLPKTRSIPYWATSVFSSTVTDLVLIYESVTSSASVVRWLTLHNWPLNSLANASLNSLTDQLIHKWTFFYKLGRTDDRSPSRTFRVLLCYYLCFVRCYETCQANFFFSLALQTPWDLASGFSVSWWFYRR